jgi:hypothetical protein
MWARLLGVIVLVLGLAASVTALVFGVGEGLFRASKLYLAIASVIGAAALVAGIIVLVSESEAMLARRPHGRVLADLQRLATCWAKRGPRRSLGLHPKAVWV